MPTPCPICERGRPRETVAERGAAWITLPGRIPVRGYVCIVSKRHVREPFELPPNERREWWATIDEVAAAVAAKLRPDKLNYEIHGNTIEHLHLHLFPRWRGDRFEGRPIDPRDVFDRSADEHAALETALSALDPPATQPPAPRDWTVPSTTERLSLEAFVELLQRSNAVNGVVLVGSAARMELRARSDLDLVIVLEDHVGPLLVGVTTVAGRLTDLLFAYQADLDPLFVDGPAVDADSWPGRVARWLRDGSIRVDRSGRLAASADRVRNGTVPIAAGADAYRTWFDLSYDLAQDDRLRGSTDPVHRLALGVRHGRALADALVAHFRLRGLEWPGEKSAVDRLARTDPALATSLEAALTEADSTARDHARALIVETALRPVRPPWRTGEVAFQFRPGVDARQAIEDAHRTWRAIVGDEGERA